VRTGTSISDCSTPRPFLLKCPSLVVIFALLMLFSSPLAMAASPASFNGASSAVQKAFVAVQGAGKDGGNVTSLVAELNGALALVQRASSENSTNPTQASSDLNSALAIVQVVQASAAKVAQ